MSRRQIRAGWRARLRGQETARVTPQSATKMLSPARISVHIAELHMQSFPRSDAMRVADGLQQELSSLLASEGVPQPWLRSSGIESVRLQDMRLQAASKSQVVAQRLAQALMQTKEWREGK